ncbi:ribonuclease HIII [Lentibacillus amyloliquefaciens]|uniref:Ribonuclease HIII n=1 Tax=Lentibacillus amyloliquefaciens TaxID=1472767 RepID=A0A0U4E4R2_9BACI|nr:ribonuclease HIII [Lentibacillus amyloliquefaciens]ALX48252.1 ribonuclease HIII [Lentibacillus amyloliquefaciens]
MPQTVYVFPADLLQQMEQYYAGQLQTTPAGALFRAKTSNAVITAYKSGKVLFQGKSPAAEAEKWTDKTEEEQVKQKKAPKQTMYTPPDTLPANSHIGSDEAGTGDYFGPITTAAVFVRKEQIELLKELGVKDSKNLSDSSIRLIAEDILKLEIPYSLLVLRNEKYNQLQKRGWSQGKMKAMLHHHAITNVLKKINFAETEGILIDQFCEPAVFKRHIATENKQLHDRTYFMTKAESSSIAVAAASIIARTSFLKEMEQLSQKAGLTLPKGASGKVDQAASRLIKSHGQGMLDSYAKTHFANTKKALDRT